MPSPSDGFSYFADELHTGCSLHIVCSSNNFLGWYPLLLLGGDEDAQHPYTGKFPVGVQCLELFITKCGLGRSVTLAYGTNSKASAGA